MVENESDFFYYENIILIKMKKKLMIDYLPREKKLTREVYFFLLQNLINEKSK